MTPRHRMHLLPFPAFLTVAACVSALLAGCGVRTIELAPRPEVVALTPAPDRLSDAVLKRDLAFLDDLDARAARLPESSATRAEAAVWIEAARAEYLNGSRHPWVDQAAQNARAALERGDHVPADSSARQRCALQAWIAHVRGTRGFRAALPLIARAEALVAVPTLPAADARPRDLTEPLHALQGRLVRLHDESAVTVADPAWAKAQAWLDLAIAQHHIRDRSGIVNDASAQAEKLIDLLERVHGARQDNAALPDLKNALAETPLLGDSSRAPAGFRADLWTLAANAPASAARSQLEVALIHAAHERARGGRASSRPYERDAERLAETLPSVAQP